MISHLGSRKGFTLIEMLIVVAIIGILSALTVPSYKRFNAHQNLMGAARELYSDMRAARVSAIKDGVQYGIYFPNTGQFQVIKVSNAPTYTSFAQASAAHLSPLYSVITTYGFNLLGYYGITMTLPGTTPVFSRTGAVSSVNGIGGASPSFSTAAPGNIVLTNVYGETKTVSINTAGFVSIN